MSITLPNQIKNTILRSERPIIILPEKASAEQGLSALGLARIIKKLGKSADIVGPKEAFPDTVRFLKDGLTVKSQLDSLRSLEFLVDLKSTELKDLSYSIENNLLKIHLIPQTGVWELKDVKLATSAYAHDLIITVGVKSREDFSEINRNAPQFLLDVPTVNFNQSAAGEPFASLDFIDLTCQSLAEVIFKFCQELDPDLIDKEIASALFASLFTATRGLRGNNISPNTLKVASQLVDFGADRARIVENLFRTKSADTLKTWGLALSNLQKHPILPLVWTTFPETTESMDDNQITELYDSLISACPEAQIVAIASTQNQIANLTIFARPPANLTALLPQATHNPTFSKLTDPHQSSGELLAKTIGQLEMAMR